MNSESSYTDAEVVDTVENDMGETFRARIFQDIYADEPEFDGGCHIVQVINGRHGLDAEMTGYGQCAEYPDGLLHSASDIIERFGHVGRMDGDMRTGIDIFERYLRIFHDGNLVEYGQNRATDYTYVAYVTRTLWESWGNTGEVGKADLDEWRAYVEGAVYGVVIEELTTWTRDVPCADREGRVSDDTRETWETVDSCGGFYGYEYAEESAREQLAYFSGKV